MTSEPKRYDCLCCDEQFLEDDELVEHVEQYHDPDDIVRSLLPINIPAVARFEDEPEITTEREAQTAIRRDGREGETPEKSEKAAQGICPICDEEIATDAEAPSRLLPRQHGDSHDVMEWYGALRSVVPDGYDESPTYDDGGLDDPAGTVMQLAPGDVVRFDADGWSQSVSTGRYQRGSISDDDEWSGIGIVTSVDDPRDDWMSHEFDRREVWIRADTDLDDEPREITLSPKDDGSVNITMGPLVTQEAAARQHGRTGGGDIRSEVAEVERTPWHRRPAN